MSKEARDNAMLEIEKATNQIALHQGKLEGLQFLTTNEEEKSEK